MEARRRSSTKSAQSLKPTKTISVEEDPTKASDGLPLPLYLTNAVFFTLFFYVVSFLLSRWREKIRTSTPISVVTFFEIMVILAFVASFIYLLGFFRIDFVQSLLLRPSNDVWNSEEDDEESEVLFRKEDACKLAGGQALDCSIIPLAILAPIVTIQKVFDEKLVTVTTKEDEEVIKSLVAETTPSYSLESKLGDCKRVAAIRREALQRLTGKSLSGLPLDGFDYDSILGQCCEMPVGYIKIPMGIAAPLLLNGREYSVPNHGGMFDGMTRAPVVRFGTAKRAADLMLYLEDPANFKTLAIVFYSTGDAMGMNMVSKGVQNVLDFLQTDFPDMDVIGISCLVELNMLKNLTGFAMAGALGGFNSHACNIVTAVYIATGQDPAQNVESSHCITMMEADLI
ncbi:3-hydroxy-3-methylglutaryl-coenzyme A reductase 2 [Hibiscus syriacus]|uniref:3-hydroxy-3-methylglutaryl-coenzyme A reductase 2 n=1 Tax=Hibiscus syriacus TaxID=106335 RepID=A0A6A2XYC0_HIBSY|nr:3-hydroxy-3-methylglutaryl-coenzyme A reductase 2 [Hibiscus syriacus]